MCIRDRPKIDSPYIEEVKIDEIQMDTGKVKIRMELAETFYYELLSELTGTKIGGEYELIGTMKKLAQMKEEYEDVYKRQRWKCRDSRNQ